MTLKFIAFLLTVQMVISSQLVVIKYDSTNPHGFRVIQHLSPIDTLSYGAFSTPIFKNKYLFLAQPVFTVKSCPVLSSPAHRKVDLNYNGYLLELEVNINLNPLRTAGRRYNLTHGDASTFILHHLIAEETTKTIEPLSTDIRPNVLIIHSKLVIFCGTIANCYILCANTSVLDAVKYEARGEVINDKFLVNNPFLMFTEISIPIKLNCSWSLVQRTDENRTAPWSWDSHENGVSDDDTGTYWIGLSALHFITDKRNRTHYKCKLRIELEDWQGNSYWGQWNQFQVMGLKDNYRLKVGQEVAGTLINGLAEYKYLLLTCSRYHNNSYFNSTDYKAYINYYLKYLSGNSTNRSCSTTYNNIGWWFNPCFSVNINANYNTTETKGDARFNTNFSWVPMKKTLMKVNCG